MLLTIVIHQFSSIRHSLGIPGGIDIQHLLSSWLNSFVTHVFGQTHTNTAVVALFWAIVGVFVYVLVLGVMGSLRELGSDIEERTYLWPQGANPHSPLVGFFERAGVHVVALVILALYIFYPLAIVLHSPSFISGATAHSSLIVDVIWFVVGTIVWHGLVVVLRLLFLRNRIFG